MRAIGSSCLEPSPLMGEGWVGVVFVQSLSDGRRDTVGIAQYLVVPEAQDAITFRFHQFRSSCVPGSAILAAIDFDDEPRPVTGEVCGEPTHRHLPPKTLVGKVFADQAPE